MKAACLLALLAWGPTGSNPGMWEYRTPDGVVHYVGDPGAIPVQDQASARAVNLSQVSLNSQTARQLEASRAPPARSLAQWPDWRLLLGSAIGFLLVALGAERRLRTAPTRRGLRFTAWAATLLFFGCGALLGLQLASPRLKAMQPEVAKFTPAQVQAERLRSTEQFEKSFDVDQKPNSPAKPFWSGAPPPEGLLHH